MKTFKVGLTRDFLNKEGVNSFGYDGTDFLKKFDSIAYDFLTEHKNLVEAGQLKGLNGVISLTPQYNPASLQQAESLIVIARYGVGYDMVDLQACTAADVAVTITPQGVRKPVAYSILTLLLALAHQLPAKSRLIREQRWNDRTSYPGKMITGKTFGSVGLGNIAREMFRMAKGFEMKHIAYDPYIDSKIAEQHGVELVDLDTLCARSDFMAINCFLSKDTFHLISEKQLRLMKPTAYLINTARGGIVDEKALIQALQNKWIEGAGLDVFEEEPFVTDSPLHHMENVMITPHSLCWTDELYQGLWRDTTEAIVSCSRGELPANVVNKEVLQKAGFLQKLNHFAG